jgi:hypothetical protein
MELNLFERYELIKLLPEKGNFETMNLIDNLLMKLYPSEKEVEEFEIKQTEKEIVWNDKGKQPKMIEFTKAQRRYIEDIFNKLSEEGELNLAQFKLFKKLIE